MTDMNISVIGAEPWTVATPLLVVPWFEGGDAPAGSTAELDRRAGGVIGRVLRGDFHGNKDEALVLYPVAREPGPERLLLVGMGKRDEFSPERVRRLLGTAVRQCERLRVPAIAVLAEPLLEEAGDEPLRRRVVQAMAEGAILGDWDFRELKTVAEADGPRVALGSLTVLCRDPGEAPGLGSGADAGRISARAANLARELAARPGNIATPTHLAEIAAGIAQDHGMELTVLDRQGMAQQNMGALLAVAQGTEEEPRFIVLDYRGGPDGERPVVLVGKGITFDSGGISIKPAQNMEEMKYDMSGAAAVLGAMRGAAELGLRINVVGLIASTENLPSGRALKPGDVIRTRAGKTVEVVNTDAEGRLVLADALSYAQRYEPRAIVDAATLTGACVVALGHHAAAVLGSDDGLLAEIRAAGDAAGERCWPLPLWDDYRVQLDSTVADLKNTGGRPAGTITAGWFLREFAGDVPWAHLDIAGTAYRDEVPPYLRKGPTGAPSRLFIEWLRARAEQA